MAPPAMLAIMTAIVRAQNFMTTSSAARLFSCDLLLKVGQFAHACARCTICIGNLAFLFLLTGAISPTRNSSSERVLSESHGFALICSGLIANHQQWSHIPESS